jgi:hypothetical protein
VGEAPPLVGVAVKVTGVAAQIVPEGEAAMATEGVMLEVTFIVIGEAGDTGVVEAQLALLVISTVITSLLLSVLLL